MRLQLQHVSSKFGHVCLKHHVELMLQLQNICIMHIIAFLWVCVGTCRASGEDVVEDAKGKAEDVKNFAGDAVHDVGKETRSWADWAKEKFSKTFGGGEDNEKHVAQNMRYISEASEYDSGGMGSGNEKAREVDNDGDHAKIIRMPNSFENAKQNTYTASDKASSMAHNAKVNMDESIQNAKDKATDAYDDATHKAKRAMDCGGDKAADAFDEAKERMKEAGEKADDAKDKMSETMGNERDKVAETFDKAKQELSEAYAAAKNTMTEEAKAKYEAEKEKASSATGDLGATMRDTPNL
ncbi:hypothetical protein VNO78_08336 [Psophocarpus tetragonolobus]|uniref:Late embryogenesis abundant protein D-29 n=1 Tax=Psophocarpus tetragonolobus TaxID=3891 RepID=A0AAN9SUZ2_PSOTE